MELHPFKGTFTATFNFGLVFTFSVQEQDFNSCAVKNNAVLIACKFDT